MVLAGQLAGRVGRRQLKFNPERHVTRGVSFLSERSYENFLLSSARLACHNVDAFVGLHLFAADDQK